MTQFFYEFCCRSGGDNLNAGTLTGDTSEPSVTPLVTYPSGSWVQGTGVFTPASGDPTADGVVVGMWASVYPDGTTGNTVFSSRVLARDATTITLDVAGNYHGAAPADGAGNRTMRVGGAWVGMNALSNFPLTSFLRKYTFGLPVKVNLKNDQTYNITTSLIPTATLVKLQGYTSVYTDGGKATIDGGTVGASYLLFDAQLAWTFWDLIFQNNGATGNAGGLGLASASGSIHRCVVRHIRGYGIAGFSAGVYECEAYDCNQSNTAGYAGIHVYNNAVNCISHHNLGSNSLGFVRDGVGPHACTNCIAAANGGRGFGNVVAINCDSYNNGGAGFQWSNSIVAYIENSNAVKNGGWGFDFLAGCTGSYAALRYGAGTQANTLGGISVAATAALEEISPASAYPNDVTPWADPDNGDFRIVLGAAMGTGRGEFTQEYPGFSDITTAYPDIGAVWHRTGMRTIRRFDGGFNG